MIRQPSRRPVQAKTARQIASQIARPKITQTKKEPVLNKNVMLIVAALFLVVLAFVLRSREHPAPPQSQRSPVESGQAGMEGNVPASKGDAGQPQITLSEPADGTAAMTRIKVTPEQPKVGDTIKISATVPGGDDNSKLPFSYEWYKNGEKLEESSNSLLLSNGFKRGDKIEFKVTLDDGKGKKNSWNCKLNISNSPPEIVSATDITRLDNNRFTFQVKAKDADGDQLRYSLRPAVEGVGIDPLTGKVTITVPEGKKGKILVTVLVSDEHGGEATYSQGISLGIAAP